MEWCDARVVTYSSQFDGFRRSATNRPIFVQSSSLGSNGDGAAFTLRVIELISASIKIHSIGRLGVLGNLIKLPFEQVADIGPIVTDESNHHDQREYKLAEAKIAS